MIEIPTEFEPPSHPPLISVDWDAFDAEFGFSLPDEYRHHIELAGNDSPLRYTEYEEFYNRRSWHVSDFLYEHARIIHPERGPLDPRYAPYSIYQELFKGFREWYGEVGYHRPLVVDLVDDDIDFVEGIGDLYDAAQTLDERVDWPADGHPTLVWHSDHDKEKYRDLLYEWRLTVTHDDPDELTSLDCSDLPVEPERIYTPPRKDDRIIFRHKRYHRAPAVIEPWDARTHRRLDQEATEIGLHKMETRSVSWLFDGFSTEISHRPIEYLPLEGKEAMGFATVYEYEKHGETRSLAAWPDNLENDRYGTDARLCRFSSPPTAHELKRGRALTDIRKQFYSHTLGLDVEFECAECGQETHWLDVTRDDMHALSLGEKAEHADRHNCGCVVVEDRNQDDFNVEFDPPEHPALLSIDWEAFEADMEMSFPDEVRYLIERRGKQISQYTSEYDDLQYSTEIDAVLTDHASLVHPDRGPLDQRYVPYENAKSLFKSFRRWYDDPMIAFRPLVMALNNDETDFMEGIGNLYDAAQALDDRVDWPADGHPTLSYDQTGGLMYGSEFLDTLGECHLSASHNDPAVLSSLDCADLRVEAERVYTPPPEDDQLRFRHERYHRKPWAVEPWDERTHQFLNDLEADSGFLTIDSMDWSSTHPFKDGVIDYQLVGYVPIGAESPLVFTPRFTEGFATVYEYTQHGETRYLAEWPERLEFGGYSRQSWVGQFSSLPTEHDIEVARAVTAIRKEFRDESVSDEFECEDCGRETHWLDLTTDDGDPLSLAERAEQAANHDCGC